MRALLLLLCLAGCGEAEPEAPPRKPKPRAEAPAAPAPARVPEAVEEAGEDARTMLRLYYGHIEAGRYAEAWAMRGGKREGAEAFARNFAALPELPGHRRRAEPAVSRGGGASSKCR
jgi:hypothetical protein